MHIYNTAQSGPREPHDDDDVNEMTLPCRHRIRNSTGDLGPSTLPMSQRLPREVFANVWGWNIVFETWIAGRERNPQTPWQLGIRRNMQYTDFTANKTHGPNVGLVSANRLKRWSNIESTYQVKVLINLSRLRCILFANYSRNFHPIVMKFGKHYFLVLRQLPWKWQEPKIIRSLILNYDAQGPAIKSRIQLFRHICWRLIWIEDTSSINILLGVFIQFTAKLRNRSFSKMAAIWTRSNFKLT